MDNYAINSLTFQAQRTNIRYLDEYDKQTQKANRVKFSIVQFDPTNPEQLNSIKNAVRSWGAGDDYGFGVYVDARIAAKRPERIRKYGFYVATLQNKDFDNLDSAKIIGVIETYKKSKKNIFIDKLQVKPEFTYHKGQYVHIGKGIIEALKSRNKNRAITLKSVYSACNFYEKMGFDIIDPQQLIYLWKRKKVHI